MSLEVVLLTPVLIILFLFLVLVGRLVNVQSQLDGAARDGARAASVARDEGAAQAFAVQAVDDSIAGTSFCVGGAAQTDVDLGEWGPGGQVTVTVTCTTDLTGLALVPFAGDPVKTGSASAPIDTYRRIDCGGAPCAVEEE
ncbi:TadE/TadG family type IV pilus assembly protein [Actinocorallia sp. A-T 12471]|uniref:TadE/TadG family type IV pilus assembly protein n=1 Tax=Actinocorallia sp. A-T 12471 TaxID=3089813 RepID=UPI0029CD30A3|nr:TadE/TadG family type IV pilus assembly protein [Actinocorallia sp. A-T 12471]MDX6744536.1 TadE/TadG family type IV pilus assembly protein [Actinocorallia sp. A-T 12471]